MVYTKFYNFRGEDAMRNVNDIYTFKSSTKKYRDLVIQNDDLFLLLI